MLRRGRANARRKKGSADKHHLDSAEQPAECPEEYAASKTIEQGIGATYIFQKDGAEPARLSERAAGIKQKVGKLLISGRSLEKEQILNALLDARSVSTHVFGRPGTGKTFVAQKVLQVFESEGIEVYTTNILLDTEFTSVFPDNVSDTVILLVDEYENRGDVREYCKRKEKLLQLMRGKGRTPEPSIKTLFISNSAKKTGIRFRPYNRENLKEILSEITPGLPLEDKVLRISMGVEKGDIRAALQPSIGLFSGNSPTLPVSSSPRSNPSPKETPGKKGQLNAYHQFVVERIKDGASSARQIYAEFISEMRQKGLPLISKDHLQCIVDEHMNRA